MKKTMNVLQLIKVKEQKAKRLHQAKLILVRK